jgi:MscS family membrane protein
MDAFLALIEEYVWVFRAFGVLLCAAVIRFVVGRLLTKAEAKAKVTANDWDDALVISARKPLFLGIWVMAISFAVDSINLQSQAEVFGLTDNLRDIAMVWLLIWFAVNLTQNVEAAYVEGRTGKAVDPTTAAAVGKLLRATIVITGVLMAMQALGFSISGVLALGGVGGIAIGFAARSLLSNFFGALMIFLDRPFSVGDWVRSPDQNIEGTVEAIGWRVTVIRTFDQRPLYVPNSVFTEISVENPSRMHNRRINETLGIRYSDLPKMQAIVDDVKQMLVDHDDIDKDRTLMVNFVTFGASSLNFFIYTFTKTTDWSTFHAVKQDVLLRIADIVAGHGAEFAFPTQSLYLESPEALASMVQAQEKVPEQAQEQDKQRSLGAQPDG